MVTSSGFFMHYKKAILNSFINMGNYYENC